MLNIMLKTRTNLTLKILRHLSKDFRHNYWCQDKDGNQFFLRRRSDSPLHAQVGDTVKLIATWHEGGAMSYVREGS